MSLNRSPATLRNLKDLRHGRAAHHAERRANRQAWLRKRISITIKHFFVVAVFVQLSA